MPPTFRIAFGGSPDVTRVSLSVWNWDGEIVYSRDFDNVVPDGTELSFRIDGFGTWMLTLDAYGGDDARSLKSRLIRSFSVLPPTKESVEVWNEKNDYFIGSCFFPLRYHRWTGWKDYGEARGYLPPLAPGQVVDKLAGLAARAGLQTLRIEPFTGNFDRNWGNQWDLFEETATTLEKHGVKMGLKVAITPKVFEGETLSLNHAQWDFWRDGFNYYLTRLLNRDEHNVYLVEIGNEPAHHEFWRGTREQYQYLYKYCYDEIRKVDPDVMIVAGGTCMPGADLGGIKLKAPELFKKKQAAQKEWYAVFFREMGGLSPLSAYHWHGKLPRQLEWREWEREQLDLSGYKDVVLIQTEGGVCAWRPDFEAPSWKDLMQKVFYSWSRRDRGWVQYSLAFQPIPYRDVGGDNGWTMLNSWVFAPRFQYGAWAALSHWMAGATFSSVIREDGPADDRDYVLLFDHPRGKMVVYFTTGKTEKSISLPIEKTSDISFIDSMGNVTEHHSSSRAGESVALELTNAPKYVLFSDE